MHYESGCVRYIIDSIRKEERKNSYVRVKGCRGGGEEESDLIIIFNA